MHTQAMNNALLIIIIIIIALLINISYGQKCAV